MRMNEARVAQSQSICKSGYCTLRGGIRLARRVATATEGSGPDKLCGHQYHAMWYVPPPCVMPRSRYTCSTKSLYALDPRPFLLVRHNSIPDRDLKVLSVMLCLQIRRLMKAALPPQQPHVSFMDAGPSYAILPPRFRSTFTRYAGW